jgi:glycyl-tRNA synthetase (class II)
MAELKTKVTQGSVDKFLDSIVDEAKCKDSYSVFKMMQNATKDEARMWICRS